MTKTSSSQTFWVHYRKVPHMLLWGNEGTWQISDVTNQWVKLSSEIRSPVTKKKYNWFSRRTKEHELFIFTKDKGQTDKSSRRVYLIFHCAHTQHRHSHIKNYLVSPPSKQQQKHFPNYKKNTISRIKLDKLYINSEKVFSPTWK